MIDVPSIIVPILNSVGVRNLIKVRQKYLFRSLLTKRKPPNRVVFLFDCGYTVGFERSEKTTQCVVFER